MGTTPNRLISGRFNGLGRAFGKPLKWLNCFHPFAHRAEATVLIRRVFERRHKNSLAISSPKCHHFSGVEKLETILLENLGQFTGFVRKRISDPELAADIVQDSLLKALKSGDQLRENENVTAWFYKILRNAIIDVYRRRDVSERAVEKLKVDLESAEEITTEVCRCMNAIIPTLKPEYAELIRRVDLAENSPANVATELGITTNNLTVRLHRARAQLRERLEQTCQMCSTHGCLNCTCDPA